MARKLYVTSKKFSDGARLIGVLYENDGKYRFEYKQGGVFRESYLIIEEFPTLNKDYESKAVMDFINRIIPQKDSPYYETAMKRVGLKEHDVCELLKYFGGEKMGRRDFCIYESLPEDTITYEPVDDVRFVQTHDISRAERHETSEWKFLYDERQGATPNMAWVERGEGATYERALFKPDSYGFNGSYGEYETYKIATALGIPCAKIEIDELFGMRGILSYDICKKDDVAYVHAGAYFRNGGEPGYGNLSMDEVKKNPIIEEAVVQMLFLDCLVSNCDRNGRNWFLEMSTEGNKIVGLAPLFDHGKTHEEHSPNIDYCRVYWNEPEDDIASRRFLRHYEMLEHLSRDYPHIIGALIEKCEKRKFR